MDINQYLAEYAVEQMATKLSECSDDLEVLNNDIELYQDDDLKAFEMQFKHRIMAYHRLADQNLADKTKDGSNALKLITSTIVNRIIEHFSKKRPDAERLIVEFLMDNVRYNIPAVANLVESTNWKYSHEINIAFMLVMNFSGRGDAMHSSPTYRTLFLMTQRAPKGYIKNLASKTNELCMSMGVDADFDSILNTVNNSTDWIQYMDKDLLELASKKQVVFDWMLDVASTWKGQTSLPCHLLGNVETANIAKDVLLTSLRFSAELSPELPYAEARETALKVSAALCRDKYETLDVPNQVWGFLDRFKDDSEIAFNIQFAGVKTAEKLRMLRALVVENNLDHHAANMIKQTQRETGVRHKLLIMLTDVDADKAAAMKKNAICHDIGL